MAENAESLWLKTARKPMYWVMMASICATVLLAALLIVGQFFFDLDTNMRDFLSPSDAPLVMATMIAGAVATLSASVYLSDTCGIIEQQPSGFFDIVSLICSRVSMIGITGVVLVMLFEVVSRYVFEKPTLWANELSLWMAGFIFLLAGLYAMQQRSHIRIYVVYDLFPRWLQKLSDITSVLLIWVFTFMLIWGGYNEARDKFLRWETFGTAWDPPLPATIKPAILIVLALVAIQALSNLIADWNKMPEHHSPLDDIDEVEIEDIRKSIKE
ncbi:TRAP transporter small permease [Hoeflea sp. YIM 152468]|uniref:TRAP transporter small permease subunit n=1 Tax=Hoeflea sp. YIM 152468 TaxID=3031759 RepID=UPI0023D9A6E9|nr:TRAP transporter small permease [Hoeflea sp. YIM 152468]MDF1610188.1 TRAP transporter small permease [Hoeflea sp. YIM 152468]